MLLEYSINRKCIGKPLTKKSGDVYFAELANLNTDPSGKNPFPMLGLLGKKYYPISTAKKWENITTELDGLFYVLADVGIAICGQLLTEHGAYIEDEPVGYRLGKNFYGTNVALVDVDDGMKIKELKNHTYYKTYCSGYYTTPSHTEEHNRYRLVFILPYVIRDGSYMEAIYTSLIKIFGGDKACHDPARVFYGSPGAKYEMIEDHVLSEEAMAKLIIDGLPKLQDKTKTQVKTPVNPIELSNGERRYVISSLKNHYLGHYPDWWNVAVALMSGGYTLEEFTDATVGGMMDAKDETDCSVLWNSIVPGTERDRGPITMGTVYALIGKNTMESKIENMQRRINAKQNEIKKLKI